MEDNIEGRKRRLSGDGQHFYQVLGIEKGSNTEAIRKAYLRKSRENHPDRNPQDKDAEFKMAEISHANSILTDLNKKEIYDCFGSEVCYKIIDGIRHWFHDCDKKGCVCMCKGKEMNEFEEVS